MKKNLLALFLSCLISTALFAEKILHRGNSAEPQSLDHQKTSGVPESNIILDLMEGLVTTAANGKNIPGVASSWTISPDGLVYTFILRDNAKWSNGDPVTANDFVYAWRRMVDPKTASTWTYIIQPILNADEIVKGTKEPKDLGVAAKDDRTLVVTLKAPTPYILSLFAHACMMPIHQKTVEANPEKWMRPGIMVSNGPFMLDEWVPQSHIRTKKNPNYWDMSNIKLDSVVYYPIDDRHTELKRFKAQELDMTYFVPTDQIAKLKTEMKDAYRSSTTYATYYYTFNTTKAPFDNVKLRKALALAINREKLVSEVTKGDEKPAYSIVPPSAGIPYTPQEMMCEDKACKSLTQDQRETLAKKLFQEAGYSIDKPLKVGILYNTDDNHKKVAIAISGMWKDVLGIETELTNKEWKVFLAARQKRDYEVYRQIWRADYSDPNTFLILFKSDSGSDNTPGFNSPNYDKLIETAAASTDPVKRMEILMKAEKTLLDGQPFAPIYYFVENRLISPKITGFEESPMAYHLSRWIDIKE